MNLRTFDCFRDSIAIYFHKLRAIQRSHFHWEHPLHYLDCRLVATINIIFVILTSLIIGLLDYSIIGFIIIIKFGYLVEPLIFFSTPLFMSFFFLQFILCKSICYLQRDSLWEPLSKLNSNMASTPVLGGRLENSQNGTNSAQCLKLYYALFKEFLYLLLLWLFSFPV